MGTNFCVCNDSNNKEQESNIFSIIKNSRNGKENELKTVTLQNKLTKGSEFKSIRDDNINKYLFSSFPKIQSYQEL